MPLNPEPRGRDLPPLMTPELWRLRIKTSVPTEAPRRVEFWGIPGPQRTSLFGFLLMTCFFIQVLKKVGYLGLRFGLVGFSFCFVCGVRVWDWGLGLRCAVTIQRPLNSHRPPQGLTKLSHMAYGTPRSTPLLPKNSAALTTERLHSGQAPLSTSSLQ